MPTSQPISVMLPAQMRARLVRQADKRSLKVSTALRVLLEERLRELETDDELGRAEAWQRVQVWASWERYQRGENGEAGWDALEAMFDGALGRSSEKSFSPRTSRRTSKARSRG